MLGIMDEELTNYARTEFERVEKRSEGERKIRKRRMGKIFSSGEGGIICLQSLCRSCSIMAGSK